MAFHIGYTNGIYVVPVAFAMILKLLGVTHTWFGVVCLLGFCI